MQLESAGITGVKFLSIDFFDVKDNPPPNLPFPVRPNYIPAASSTMKNLEDAVVKAVNRFPEIVDQLMLLTKMVNHLLVTIDDEKIPQEAGKALRQASHLLATLESTTRQADLGGLSAEARRAIGSTGGAIAHLDAILAKAGGDQGLVASAQRATDSIGDLAGGAKGVGDELQDTLRGLREAADSIQRLSDALDTDSDMLLKGRAKGRPR